jgi:hypothetical protein
MSSTKNGTDGTLIKDEVVELPTLDAFAAIHAYNASHPDRTVISSSVVLPNTPEDHLRETYPRYHRNGQWVDETD